MNNKELKKIPVHKITSEMECENFRTSKAINVIKATIEKIETEEILHISFFNTTLALTVSVKPFVRLFIAKDNYISQMLLEDGTYKWSLASIDNLFCTTVKNSVIEYQHCWEKKAVCLTSEDEKTIDEFLNSAKELKVASKVSLINIHQEKIRGKVLKGKHDSIKKAIDEKMQVIAPLPENIESWILKKVFADFHYIYYKRDKKQINGFCTYCETDVLLQSAKHNIKAKCPNCNHHITIKALGKSKHVNDFKHFSYIQKSNNDEIIIREFKAFVKRDENYKTFKLNYTEVKRTFLRNQSYDAFYFGSFKQTNELRWCEGNRPHMMGLYDDYTTVLYQQNISDVLLGTPFQYSHIDIYAKYIFDFNVFSYLRTYLSYPLLEYLVKLGLYTMASELMNSRTALDRVLNLNGKSFSEILLVKPTQLKSVQKLDMSSTELDLFRNICLKFEDGNMEEKENQMLWIRENQVTRRIFEITEYTTLSKAINFLKKQSQQIAKISLTLWLDYLGFCKGLGYKINDSIILFPKDLKSSHDKASEDLFKLKTENKDKVLENIEKITNENYRFEFNNLFIRAPKSTEDFVSESNSLRHCVKNFIDSHVKGTITILFIRKKEEPDKSYFTLELRNNKIIQCLGKGNCAYGSDIKTFLDKWYEEKLRVKIEKGA